MSRDAVAAVAIGGILLVVVALAGVALVVGTKTTVISGEGIQIPDPPADGSSGLVFDLREHGGFSVAGINIHAPTREAQVGMVVPPECVGLDGAGAEVLLSDGVCAGLPARGEVSGGGSTVGGGRLVFVRIAVQLRCYEALAIGDRWPSSADGCVKN